jgi:hypothetical protein
METEDSLQCSQEFATRPNHEEDESNPHIPPHFLEIQFYIILPMSSEWLLPSKLPTKILYAFLTFAIHVIFFHLITPIVFDEEFKLWSVSLYSFQCNSQQSCIPCPCISEQTTDPF